MTSWGQLWIFIVGTFGIYGGHLWEDVLICRLWGYLSGYYSGARMADRVALLCGPSIHNIPVCSYTSEYV